MRSALVTSPRPSAARSRRVGWRWALGAFLAVALVLAVVVPFSSAHFSEGEAPRYHAERFDSVLGPWLQWDARWYQMIAEHGYDDAQVAAYDAHEESAAAFFPGYPLLVRWTTPVFGETALAMIALTFLSGALLVVLFLAWCRRREIESSARYALLALLLFPYGYYLVAAPYGDALFLTATLAAFLLVEGDRPLLAGLAGAVATATRPVGIAVVVALVMIVLQRRGAWSWSARPRFARSRLRRADAGVLLSCVGAGAFMAFLWARFGSPIAYSITQRGWDQEMGLRTLFKIRFFDHVLHDPRPGFVLRLAFQAVLIFVLLATVPLIWRRYGAPYGTYTLIVLALPTAGSATFISVGRYVLAAFPAFALAGSWLSERPPAVARAVLGVSAIGLVIFASCYGRGYFMA